MPTKALERVVRLAARVLRVPLVVVTSAEIPDRPLIALYEGRPVRDLDLPADLSMQVPGVGEFSLADLNDDPVLARAPLTVEGAVMRFGAGVPLHTGDGTVPGALCLFDTRARTFTDGQADILRELAALAAAPEVSGLHRTQASLQHRLDLESALTGLSQHFMADVVDEHHILEVLGKAVGVDRAYLFRFREGGRKMDNTYEWCAPGIRPEIERFQDLDAGPFTWSMAQLRAGDVVSLADVEAMPEEARAEREMLQVRNARAALIVPVRWKKAELSGFVGFDDAEQPRRWLTEDVRVLRIVSDMMTRHLIRRHVERALRESEERWRWLVQHSPDAILVQIDDQMVYLNDAGCRLFGAASDEVVFMHALSDFILPSHHDRLTRLLAADLPDEAAGTAPFPLLTFEGDLRYVEIFAQSMIYEGQRAVEVVLHDVTQRKLYEEHLIESKELAERMSRIKSAFLADMSHEIRTPLTSVIGFADLLVQEVVGEQRELARFIQESGRRLMQTINSVLELAQLEGGAAPFTFEQVDLGEEARELVNLFELQARQKGLTLALEMAEGPRPEALVDRAAFNRVLINLISNAIKFTAEGGVTVVVQAGFDRVAVSVKDTGIGISPEFLPHLFDEFSQERAEDVPVRQGSGLGLAITKRLVERMNGEISVRSGPVRGSVFTVHFPRFEEAAKTEEDDLRAA